MFDGQSVAITGAAGGIGRAIAERFIAEGANVAISDINAEAVAATASEIGAESFVCDVSDEAQVQSFILGATTANGPVDVFVSNAGIGLPDQPGGHAAGGSNESWEKSWQVNVMSSIYASRALLPDWLEKGRGRFIIVASAAGLLAQVYSGSYTTTKHAALGYAEYLAIMHKDQGVDVHCVCPQYVKTNMTAGMTVVEEGPNRHIEPWEVADSLFTAMKEDKFLVLPHPVVKDYAMAKLADHDTYIKTMSELKHTFDIGQIPLQENK